VRFEPGSAVLGHEAHRQALVDALAYRHAKDVFVPECKMGETWGEGARRLDAWALSKSWSPLTAWGYEVKVSRSDFLQDRKWERYLGVCHEFAFVCPRGLIQPEELPEGVGLLWSHGQRLMTKRKPVRREPDGVELVRLMAYVLMSRSQIVENMWRAASADPAERWRALLTARDGDRIGRMVSRRVAQRLNEAIAERLQASASVTASGMSRSG
jgi:hypothetical protein